MKNQGPAGLLVVDKPAGMTSHDVVKVVRRLLGARAGHAGTLDPQATGVLLVCTGAATRLARFLQGHDKLYEGVVRLGWATDTYDAEGTPLSDPVEPPALDAATVEAELARFVGAIEQRPPAYSAKKIDGEPAYRRARRGEAVEPEAAAVEIHAAELLRLEEGEIYLRIHCGPGTYVRTLAHELGEALGCPAHLARLRRLRSGPFRIEAATPLDELEAAEADTLRDLLVPPAEMLPDWPAAVVDDEGAADVGNGRVVEPRSIVERVPGTDGRTLAFTPGEDRARVLDREGNLLAVAEVLPGGVLQPRVVLQAT